MSEKLTYHWEGDYLIPDSIPPESPHIGIWGERRRRYLRTHQRLIYDTMLMSGTLTAHLEEVDRSADELFDRLMMQMARRAGITEDLKTWFPPVILLRISFCKTKQSLPPCSKALCHSASFSL